MLGTGRDDEDDDEEEEEEEEEECAHKSGRADLVSRIAASMPVCGDAMCAVFGGDDGDVVGCVR